MKKIITISFLLISFLKIQAQETFPVNGITDPRHITYAFKNATIFIDYKTKIPEGTLIIRDGYIVDAAAKLSVPSDAVVYDLKGKYIYPSLIDIFSDYGLPEIKKPAPNDNPQFISSLKGAYGWNQSVKPEYDAYKNFSVDPKKAEDYRKSGFGAVMSVNKDGIVRGTSVLALTGNGRENDLVIKDRAAANFSFDPGTSTQDYPNSLMGAIALIRQTYYDAKWYQEGGYNKEYNISLDAFNKLQNLPQVFDANDKQNELRADKIGKEFNKNYIIKGSGTEYERLDEIAQTGSALIVPLNFPEGYDLSDPYDALNVPLARMKQWELAPYNAAMLSSRKIDFALTASDVKTKAEFWKNLLKAIDAGLSKEDALKALTYTPARLLNSLDQIGELKKGMIANFIICTKEIFEKDNIILENRVKGVSYKISDGRSKDIRGNYSLSVNNQNKIRIKISGELFLPELFIYEDSSASKTNVLRQDDAITFQYEFKKTDVKGIFRFTGTINDSANILSGNVITPSGMWSKWIATFDSSTLTSTIKKDSVKTDSVPGKVYYPDVAFGWTELPKATSFVITNATVWTNEAEGILQNADVYVDGGKIINVGKKISVPSSVEKIDGTGMHLTSGIIDEHSHIAVTGSVNEGTQSSSAEVRIADVIDADDIQIYRQLAGGVTVSHILHGSANAIGGQTQLIKLRWGLAPEKLKFENAPPFIKFALGENVKQSHWGDKQVVRFPQTRMGVEQVYMDYFTRAKEYSEQIKNATGSKNNSGKIPVRRNLELDALSEIIQSKRFITCHSYEQSEINMLMHVADTFGFKVNTFTHILEGYKVADKMKAHGVSGTSTFADWWAYKFEVYEAIPYNGAIMHEMGLNVSFNSDDPEMARRLNQEAAKAVKYGNVSEEDAWKFVTLNPAKMLHVDNKVGSIKAGKDADLVLWNGNPLSIYSRPMQTYVDGIKYFDIQNDSIMRVQIAAEKSRLTKKMNDAKSKGEPAKKPVMNYNEIKHCDTIERYFMSRTEN